MRIHERVIASSNGRTQMSEVRFEVRIQYGLIHQKDKPERHGRSGVFQAGNTVGTSCKFAVHIVARL